MTVDKKKERMVYLGLRVPQRLLEKLERLAEKQSKRTGMPVNVSAVARTLLQGRA
jgi:hypothetical protein